MPYIKITRIVIVTIIHTDTLHIPLAPAAAAAVDIHGTIVGDTAVDMKGVAASAVVVDNGPVRVLAVMAPGSLRRLLHLGIADLGSMTCPF